MLYLAVLRSCGLTVCKRRQAFTKILIAYPACQRTFVVMYNAAIYSYNPHKEATSDIYYFELLQKKETKVTTLSEI